MKKQLYLLLNILIIFMLLSCQNESTEENETESNLIVISKEQFLSENMSLGVPKKIAIEERSHFTGKIVPMLNSEVRISAPLQGVVKKVLVQEGEQVNSHEILLYVGGSDLIDIQKEFAVSSARIKQLESNFIRTKELFKENLKSKNEYMLAESSYQTEMSNYTLLRLRLLDIGLDIESIEDSKYFSSYSIKSPIDGQISQMNVLPGQFVSQEDEIATVMNTDKVELQLAFFENDYSNIEIGQKVYFYSSNEGVSKSSAILTRKGNQLSTNSHTFKCYATIENPYTDSYAINQMVNGEVVIAADSVYAVPHSAVLSVGNSRNVFIVDHEDEQGYYVKKFVVETGKEDSYFIELVDFASDKMIIIKGAYNIGLE